MELWGGKGIKEGRFETSIEWRCRIKGVGQVYTTMVRERRGIERKKGNKKDGIITLIS